MEKLTVGSLFSGIGGIEYGLEKTGGFRTIWHCEIDKYASAVLKKHWSDLPNLGDITKVKWGTVAPPDILCGGFPCQDISLAGKGAGIKKGTRSRLWLEYAKAIRSLRPRHVLVENVSALTFRGLLDVLGDLAEIGYDARWFTISASEIGAWHRRERIFILANPNGSSAEHPIQTGRAKPAKCCEVSNPNGKRLEEQGVQQGLHSREEAIPLSNPDHAGSGTPDHKTDEKWAENDKKRDGFSQRRPGRRCEADSHPNCEWELQPKGSVENFRGRDSDICEELPNTAQVRRQFAWTPWQWRARLENGYLRNRGNIWAVEPDVGRVVDGIPARVDRIKCLGNAVVPQVAEVIGEMILEMEKCD